MRKYDPEQRRRPARATIDGNKEPIPYVVITTRCAHLGCPVRYYQAPQRFVCPCHGGIYDFQGKSTAARPCAHSTASMPVSLTAGSRSGERFSVNSELEAVLSPRPVEPSRRPLAVPLPVEAQHMSKLTPPLPKFLRPTPPRPGEKDARPATAAGQPGRVDKLKEGAAEGGAQVVGWLDGRTGASPFLRGFLFRKVPKGTNWFYTLGSATMFAFVSQAVTGVFLAMYYNPDATRAYESASHITNEVFARRAGARHAPLGLDGDDRAAVPAHGQDLRLRGLQVPP